MFARILLGFLASGALVGAGATEVIHANPVRVKELTVDHEADQTESTLAHSLHISVQPLTPAVGGIDRLGLFTLRSEGSEWQWLIGDPAPRLQMALSPDNTLRLADLAGNPRIELRPGSATVPAALILSGPADPAGIPAIALSTGPTPSITIAGQNVLTQSQAANLYVAKAPWLSFGTESAAHGADAFALGLGTVASARGQVAVGRYNIRRGNEGAINPYVPDAVFIVGNGTAALRSDAFLIWDNGAAWLRSSLSIGVSNTYAPAPPNGDGASLAVGALAQAHGNTSFALGRVSFAMADLAFVHGGWNKATGYGSASFNSDNDAKGPGAFATGGFNEAQGWNSFVAGKGSVTIGDMSFAAGSSVAEGHYSAGFGVGTKARSYSQFVIGRFNKLEGNPTSWSTPGPNVDLFFSGSVDLQAVWGVDPDGDTRKFSRHKWHSAQFRSTYTFQQRYWATLLGPNGFDIELADP